MLPLGRGARSFANFLAGSNAGHPAIAIALFIDKLMVTGSSLFADDDREAGLRGLDAPDSRP
jgi:hypothetical protein